MIGPPTFSKSTSMPPAVAATRSSRQRAEAEIVDQQPAFLLAPGDAYHPRATDLCDLTGDRSNGAGGGGNDHSLTFLRPADVVESQPGGQTREPEDAEIGARRDSRNLGHRQ